MPSDGQGTIGALDYTPEERRCLAKRSANFSCPQCGHIAGHLANEDSAAPLTSEESELVGQITFKAEEPTQNATNESRYLILRFYHYFHILSVKGKCGIKA
jgi:ubiquitin-conjugating enzyme E2 J1